MNGSKCHNPNINLIIRTSEYHSRGGGLKKKAEGQNSHQYLAMSPKDLDYRALQNGR